MKLRASVTPTALQRITRYRLKFTPASTELQASSWQQETMQSKGPAVQSFFPHTPSPFHHTVVHLRRGYAQAPYNQFSAKSSCSGLQFHDSFSNTCGGSLSMWLLYNAFQGPRSCNTKYYGLNDFFQVMGSCFFLLAKECI